uniref:NADH:ubiquinone reductase (H(+)-translocating) n=1 Tax=Trichinella pseudospiralis TaxID=6337 RepID=A0A0A0V4W2_TRIPS|nr:NADH dehydrogenase subunit 5 [Trichinella pseudospiralis]AIW56932.1 NADH dehydrogenase subunit 5 [Trichinella pseudospiralis]
MNLVSLVVLIWMVVVVAWVVLMVGDFSVMTLQLMSFNVGISFDFSGRWYYVVFGLVVLLLASWILYYASSYLSSSVGLVRFNVLVVVFVVSMLVVVVSKSFWVLWLGWEGLGVSSFLLIMYYNNWKCSGSAMTTIMMNRVGDFALMVMVVTLSCNFIFDYGWVVYSSLGLVMFMGAMIAKSAQVPMSSWLPIAMAAPTPVSSLVHSSTLVVAGCVLCVKLGDCMGVMWVNGLLVVVGLLTSLYASLMAFFELDLKKILAYSTMSQVAMVMLMLLSGLYSLMMMHVMNHALVKALLFMNIGVMISYMFAGQEVRLISCVGCGVGFVLGSVVLCLVVMCGLTFTSCYYSKEYSVCLSIKEDTLLHVVNVVMFMSVMYSLRVIYVLMGGLSGKVFLNRFGVSFANIQVLMIPVLVMGWFLIMNFSMPCNPGFDVFKALLLITPFVMLLFVLKVWVFPWVMNVDLYYEYLNSGIIGLKFFVLSFVKGLHVSGFMPLIGLVSFNVSVFKLLVSVVVMLLVLFG